jgi:centromeric protein E
VRWQLRASFLEIYNEVINDLLTDKSAEVLKIREDIQRGVHVAGVHRVLCKDEEAVFAVLQRGLSARTTGSTAMNQQSSRSHSLFTLEIESVPVDDPTAPTLLSMLNLVDLAGSERIALTRAEGERKVQAGFINKSLLVLGRVISTLSGGRSDHVPYRECKLTHILKPALGGNAKTAMICTVTPAEMHFNETISTLDFAARAKNVVNTARVNEVKESKVSMKEYERVKNKLKVTPPTPSTTFSDPFLMLGPGSDVRRGA